MKKIFASLIVLTLFSLSVFADNFPNIKYKNIGNKDKISYNSSTDTWSTKFDKTTNYFIKTKGFGEYFDYLYPTKEFAFSTNCEYEFIYNGNLIGYSNKDLKFYDIQFANGGISKRELTKEEIEQILPDYKLIYLSDFSKNTNSYKIKKHFGALKILLVNNTDDIFDDFVFTSGNAGFKTYDLRGFLTVTKPGMIQFAKKDSHINDKNWYVLLVR